MTESNPLTDETAGGLTTHTVGRSLVVCGRLQAAVSSGDGLGAPETPKAEQAEERRYEQ